MARAMRNGQGTLCAGDAASQSRIRQALRDAERDCRSIIELDHDGEVLSLAFIPLAAVHGSGVVDTVLVICSRRAGCEMLTMQMFARSRHLTRAEQNVLSAIRDSGDLADETVEKVRTAVEQFAQGFEVREETGIVAELVHDLGEVRYWYRRDGRTIPKSVAFFLLNYVSGDTADHDDEVEEARWIELREAQTALSHTGEREMIGRALAYLEEDR